MTAEKGGKSVKEANFLSQIIRYTDVCHHHYYYCWQWWDCHLLHQVHIHYLVG